MSTVFLHVGQCGNQVGRNFWKLVNQDKNVEKSATFLDSGKLQRSVHVDSEPKVVNTLLNNGRNRIRKKNVISGKRGRGSNWAMGYYGLQSMGDNSIVETTMESVRQEIERCDNFSGIVLMHSLAGGTGSGLGSVLCESLRDDYPLNFVTSCVISPCSTGESPLQHHNSVLALSHLHRFCDGVILLHNDEALMRLKKTSDASVSFDDINKHMASSLCGIFLPTDTLMSKNGYSTGLEPFEMLRVVCPMPACKFVHLLHHSRKKSSWMDLTKETLQKLRKFDSQGKPFSSLSNVVVARGGQDKQELRQQQQHLRAKVHTSYNCVKWNPCPVDVWTASSNNTKESMSLTVASNYSSIVEHLESVLKKSKTMLDAGAYLHWYWKYGLTKDAFHESFETLQTVIDDYKSAVI